MCNIQSIRAKIISERFDGDHNKYIEALLDGVIHQCDGTYEYSIGCNYCESINNCDSTDNEICNLRLTRNIVAHPVE